MVLLLGVVDVQLFHLLMLSLMGELRLGNYKVTSNILAACYVFFKASNLGFHSFLSKVLSFLELSQCAVAALCILLSINGHMLIDMQRKFSGSLFDIRGVLEEQSYCDCDNPQLHQSSEECTHHHIVVCLLCIMITASEEELRLVKAFIIFLAFRLDKL